MERLDQIPLQRLTEQFRRSLLRFPVLAGNEVVNFALDSFRRQAWLGDTIERWPARKRMSWGKKDRSPNRALLIQTGRLRRSIRIQYSTGEGVAVGSDVPYAQAHNEGSRLGVIQQVRQHKRRLGKMGKVATGGLTKSGKPKMKKAFIVEKEVEVSAHRRRINQRLPRRRFLGDSPYLKRNIVRVITADVMKSLRP